MFEDIRFSPLMSEFTDVVRFTFKRLFIAVLFTKICQCVTGSGI